MKKYSFRGILVLACAAAFCAAAGAWLWYGELIIGHVLVAFGFLVTGWTFYKADRASSYRDQPLKDGTARYDDVWGG